MSKSKLALKKEESMNDYLDNLWLEIGDVRELQFKNRMLDIAWNEKDKVPELIVELCRDPNYLHFFIKYVLNIDALPIQIAIEQILWTHSLPMIIGSRGSSKTFMLAVYCICRAVLHQGCKIVVVGASLRQSMLIWDYILKIWDNAPILRDICGGKNNCPKRDIHMAYWNCGHSRIIFLPLGNGDKIRGQRANVIICDEFSAINPNIFETVIRGFAAVKSDNLHGNVVQAYKEEVAKSLGYDFAKRDGMIKNKSSVPTILDDNQIIISGTAYYQFNHFYKYYKQYEGIIETSGDAKSLKKLFPDMNLSDNIDPSQYAIIRLPYEYLPKGMMDKTILQQGLATMDKSIFQMEYGACFPSDSEGFFLATALEAATCPIQTIHGKIEVKPMIFGKKDKFYIMGVDPASEKDNFTISIIEMENEYGTLVYQFSTNRRKFEKMKEMGLIPEGIEDYFTFCIKHIRSLYRRFGIVLIVMDASGGGGAIREGLKDPAKFEPGDKQILDMDETNEGNDKGLRILKMIEFSNHGWRRESHHGMRKDILEKKLLFPVYDSADLTEAAMDTVTSGIAYETLEDCMLEILQCKTETTLIKHHVTQNGVEQWDVPKIKGIDSENLAKELKRDRFTSLLLANWGRRIYTKLNPVAPSNSSLIVAHRNAKFNGPTVSYNSIDSNGGRKIVF